MKKASKMTEDYLIGMGFVPYNLEDEVFEEQTGHSPVTYEIEFPALDRSICTDPLENGKPLRFLWCRMDGTILSHIPEREVKRVVENTLTADRAIQQIKEKWQKELNI